MIIYQVTNKINGKSYVGQTSLSLDERIFAHADSSRSPKSYFHKAIRKYGLQSFRWRVLDVAESKEILNEKEIYWIDHLNTKIPNGYNMTDGGDGSVGYKHPEEVKKKLKEMFKGVHRSPNTEFKSGNVSPFKGKIMSLKSREKLSKARKGKPNGREGTHHAKEVRIRISERTRDGMRKKELIDPLYLSKARKGKPSHWKDPIGRAKKISDTKKKFFKERSDINGNCSKPHS